METLYQVEWNLGLHLRKTYAEAEAWAEFLNTISLINHPHITERMVTMTDSEFAELDIEVTELLVESLINPSDDAATQAWLDARDRFNVELERRIERNRKEAQK